MVQLVCKFYFQLIFLFLYEVVQYADLLAQLLHHLVKELTLTLHAQQDAVDQSLDS